MRNLTVGCKNIKNIIIYALYVITYSEKTNIGIISTDPSLSDLTKDGPPEAVFVNLLRELTFHSRADASAEELTLVLTKTRQARSGNSLETPARP